MQAPDIYLIRADLSEQDRERVQSALEITPLAAIVITMPAHIQDARNYSDNLVSKFGLDKDIVLVLARCLALQKPPIAVIGNYPQPLSSLDEANKETVVVNHQEFSSHA